MCNVGNQDHGLAWYKNDGNIFGCQTAQIMNGIQNLS